MIHDRRSLVAAEIERAAQLVDKAQSASMAAPWQRGRRREMLAAAQVMATLAVARASTTPRWDR